MKILNRKSKEDYKVLVPVPDWFADDLDKIYSENKQINDNRVELFSNHLSTILEHLAVTRPGIGLGNFIRFVAVPAWQQGYIRMSELEKQVGKKAAQRQYKKIWKLLY